MADPMRTLEHWTGHWAPLIRLILGLAVCTAAVRLLWWVVRL